MDDKELVDRILRGEEELIPEYVKRNRPGQFGLALKLLHDRQDAEETADDALLIGLRRLAKYDPSRGKLFSWLSGITIRLCKHVWRKRARVARSEARERCCMCTEPLSPEERHEQETSHELLWRVLEGLSRYFQMLIVLHALAGWPYWQVALSHNIGEAQARTDTHRAMRAARKRARELGLTIWR
jgi:RNA polymerase sigma-70 factor (ECF subfamily)